MEYGDYVRIWNGRVGRVVEQTAESVTLQFTGGQETLNKQDNLEVVTNQLSDSGSFNDFYLEMVR